MPRLHTFSFRLWQLECHRILCILHPVQCLARSWIFSPHPFFWSYFFSLACDVLPAVLQGSAIYFTFFVCIIVAFRPSSRLTTRQLAWCARASKLEFFLGAVVGSCGRECERWAERPRAQWNGTILLSLYSAGQGFQSVPFSYKQLAATEKKKPEGLRFPVPSPDNMMETELYVEGDKKRGWWQWPRLPK